MSKVTRIHPNFAGSKNAALSTDADFSCIVSVKNGEWSFQTLRGDMTRYEFIGLLQCMSCYVAGLANNTNS